MELPVDILVAFQWLSPRIGRFQSGRNPGVGGPGWGRQNDKRGQWDTAQPISRDDLPQGVRSLSGGRTGMQGCNVVGHRTVHVNDQEMNRLSYNSRHQHF